MKRNLFAIVILTSFSVGISLPVHAMGKKKPPAPPAPLRDVSAQNAWQVNDLTLVEKRAQVLRLIAGSTERLGYLRRFETETRCAKAEAATGDSLPNNGTLVTGRFQWSDKCTKEREESARAQLSPRMKELMALNPTPENKEIYAEFSNRLADEPAFTFLSFFIGQQEIMQNYYTRKGPRGNFLYPVWGVPIETVTAIANPDKWIAPTSTDTSCDVIPKYKGKGDMEFYQPVALCEAGCFAPGQKILTASGWRSAELFANPEKGRSTPSAPSVLTVPTGDDSLVTLAEDSTDQSPIFATTPIETVVRGLEVEKEDFISFVTESGKSLTVTTNHPMLTASGVMRPAGQLIVGDRLVASDGKTITPDAIHRLDRFSKTIGVTNFRMASANLRSNIIVSEGLLTGTILYQNELRDQMNRGLARISMPRWALRE